MNSMEKASIEKDAITILLWNALPLHITQEDWDFLCSQRLFTNTPDLEDIEAEFVSGTGITENKQELWAKADMSFAAYIEDLRKILALDINLMARTKLAEEEKMSVPCLLELYRCT